MLPLIILLAFDLCFERFCKSKSDTILSWLLKEHMDILACNVMAL